MNPLSLFTRIFRAAKAGLGLPPSAALKPGGTVRPGHRPAGASPWSWMTRLTGHNRLAPAAAPAADCRRRSGAGSYLGGLMSVGLALFTLLTVAAQAAAPVVNATQWCDQYDASSNPVPDGTFDTLRILFDGDFSVGSSSSISSMITITGPSGKQATVETYTTGNDPDTGNAMLVVYFTPDPADSPDTSISG